MFHINILNPLLCSVLDICKSAITLISNFNLNIFSFLTYFSRLRYNLNEEIGLYAEVGPYFAVGVGGRHKCSVDADGSDARDFEDQYSYNAFKNYDYDPNNPTRLTYQRWDAGIGFRIGAEYNQRYNVLIGADWGLADIYRTSLRDRYFDQTGIALPKVHNFNFSITVGYRF